MAGTLNKGYLWVRSKYLPLPNLSVHRIIWVMHFGEIEDDLVVDHININPLDNRIENLRLVTRSENSSNTKGKCTKISDLPKNVYNCSVKGKYRFQAIRGGQVYRLTGVTKEEATKASLEFLSKEGLYNVVP